MYESTFVEVTDDRAVSGQVSAGIASLASRLLEFILVLTLMFGPLAFGGVQPWAQWALQCIAAFMVMIWAVKQAADGNLRIRNNWLFLPLAVLGVLPGLQYFLGWTAYPHATKITWMMWLAYGALFFVASQSFRRSSSQKLFVNAMTVFGFLVAVFGIVQYLSSNGKIYWFVVNSTGTFFFGPYVNHSHYAGLMELLIPIPLLRALSRRTRDGQSILYGFAALTMITSVFVSQSMGGMIAVVAEMVLVVLAFGKRRLNLRNALAMGAVAIAVAGYAAFIDGAAIAHRIMSNSINAVSRWAILADTIHMFKAKPITGWGLGTFETVYPQFQSFYTTYSVNAAHNDYAQVMAELGIVGFGAIIAFIVLLYRSGWRNVDGWRAHEIPSLSVAAMIGCSGLLVHSFGDFNFQIPANAALFFVLAALGSHKADVLLTSPRKEA